MEEEKKKEEKLCRMKLSDVFWAYAWIERSEKTGRLEEKFRWKREDAPEKKRGEGGPRAWFGLPGMYSVYGTGTRNDNHMALAKDGFPAWTVNPRMVDPIWGLSDTSPKELNDFWENLKEGSVRDLATFLSATAPVPERHIRKKEHIIHEEEN